MFDDLLAARYLGKQLFLRDTKAMFRQSFLGIIWAFIPPFFTAAVWVFLNATGTINVTDATTNYPIFVFCGTILFQTFLEALKVPADSVNQGKAMMTKLNFPREVFLISSLYRLFFNFGLKFTALIILSFFLGNNFTWGILFFFPGVLAIILTGYSIGVLIIPFQMLYQDFGRLIALGGQILMYLTPVVYPAPTHGVLARIIQFNPIAPLISVTRNWFLGEASANLLPFFTTTSVSFLILFLGWAIYRITIPIIIERVGA